MLEEFNVDTKGALVMKRAHGMVLQAAWDGVGLPPVQRIAPNLGAPLLEMNFPFFYKLLLRFCIYFGAFSTKIVL